MPSSLLLGINNECRVHILSTAGTMWREIPYVGQEFKKLSGIPHFLWALGGDHQIYVYVYGFDVPIKIREESYENERWLPIEGFSSRLLPTDRYRFSNMDGTIDRSIDKIRLPSMAWQWESDWTLELTHNGQALDHQGWTYAVDFPSSQYHPKKQWSSCVRRRLWSRSRRYAAMDSWCAIAPLNKDATSEPFIDVAVGGHCLPASPGQMLVWAVTAHNRVMFRSGVSTKSPEGARWNAVPVPVGCEINQIAVGPTGLVWAALLDGRALVRVGITRDTLSGDNWIEIKGPGEGLKVTQLSVGVGAVWGVTNLKSVWFRKGVNGANAEGSGGGVSEEAATGCGWLEMVGKMSQVSVTENDQVFAIGADDRLVYWRTGVVGGKDLTGKRWKALHAPLQVSRASSSASLRSRSDKLNRSYAQLSRPSSMVESALRNLSWDDQSHSAPTAPTSLPVTGADFTTKFEIQPKNPKAWSPVHSVGSIVATECHPETDESVYSDGSRESGIYAEDDELCWAQHEAPWLWVNAGACTIDPNNPPNWFADLNAENAALDQSWRVRILNDLKTRTSDPKRFETYNMAVETHSWVETTEARVAWGAKAPFVDCIIQLESLEAAASLTVLNPDGATIMSMLSLNDVTNCQNSSEPGAPRLTLHIPRNITNRVVRLQLQSEALLDEWLALIADTCSKLQGVGPKVGEESVWATTRLGDIFTWDPTQLETNQLREHDFYLQKFDLSRKQSPLKVELHSSYGPGTTLTLTGCLAEQVDRFGINLEAHSTYRQRHKAHTELENICLHFNPRIGDGFVVRNSKVDGMWGDEERTGVQPFKAGEEFTLRIETSEDAFMIYVNNQFFVTYRHRIDVNSVAMLSLWGRFQPYKLVIKSRGIILDPMTMYWRQVGGHLRRVEACNVGIVWGISYDHNVYVLGGESVDYAMCDTQDFRVYENQRWNPVSGYTSTGLPTDRHMWSDASGRQKRTRDQVKLLSSKWQWISDWMIDFHMPGGVDKDGWQYAIDFPNTYHAHKNFTDMVRRRRWYRRCALATMGPWQEIGGHSTRLVDVSLETIRNDRDSLVAVWGLDTGGQVLFRAGVTRSSPMGACWEHVACDQALVSLACGPYDRVWGVDKKGGVWWREGISEMNLLGERWVGVERPAGGAELKLVSTNKLGVWVLDQMGRLHVRKEVGEGLPEGRSWQTVTIDPPLMSANNSKGFKHVSVGCNEVWVTTDEGTLARRTGISRKNPAGSGWFLGISGNWQYLTVKAFNS